MIKTIIIILIVLHILKTIRRVRYYAAYRRAERKWRTIMGMLTGFRCRPF